MTAVEISQVLLTPFLVLLGLWIAYQQWRTNRDRLRHELFERRFAIYKSAVDFLGLVMRERKASQEAQSAYFVAIQGAKLLFGNPMADYLHVIWKDVVDLETHQFIYKDLPIGDERTKEVQAAAEILKGLPNHFVQLEALVRPFLAMDRLR